MQKTLTYGNNCREDEDVEIPSNTFMIPFMEIYANPYLLSYFSEKNFHTATFFFQEIKFSYVSYSNVSEMHVN